MVSCDTNMINSHIKDFQGKKYGRDSIIQTKKTYVTVLPQLRVNKERNLLLTDKNNFVG